jgi:predicted AlkP superfamily phosphohydrolase/phosphomutase
MESGEVQRVSDQTNLRTLLVGIDGGSWSVLDPLIDAGVVPTLGSLFDEGVSGDLASQIPPWTPSAWPSLYTGVNPGKHGVFDFLRFDGYDWDLVDRTDVHEHALWELLDQRGLTSVVVNVPVTGPPRPFDGALVPGYVSPEEPACHPKGLLDDLWDQFGEYRVYAPADADGDEAIDWYEQLTRMRGAAFRHLAREHDPHFGFVQFQQTDTVFHERPEDAAAVRTVFSAVDDELSRILDDCDPDTVIVASDHGIGPYDGREFRANSFLRDESYLTTTTGDGGMPSWGGLARDDDDAPGLARRVVRAASTVGLTSQRLGRLLSLLGLDDIVLDHVSTETVRAATERVDFPASAAYVRSRTELGVRINKAGRDPEGVVSPSEYPSVRADLIEALKSVRTPDGVPAFEAVVSSEDVFHGPYAGGAEQARQEAVVGDHRRDHRIPLADGREQFASDHGRREVDSLCRRECDRPDQRTRQRGSTILRVVTPRCVTRSRPLRHSTSVSRSTPRPARIPAEPAGAVARVSTLPITLTGGTPPVRYVHVSPNCPERPVRYRSDASRPGFAID